MNKPAITKAAKKAIFQRAHSTARFASHSTGSYARRFKRALVAAWAKFLRMDWEFKSFWNADRVDQAKAAQAYRLSRPAMTPQRHNSSGCFIHVGA